MKQKGMAVKFGGGKRRRDSCPGIEQPARDTAAALLCAAPVGRRRWRTGGLAGAAAGPGRAGERHLGSWGANPPGLNP